MIFYSAAASVGAAAAAASEEISTRVVVSQQARKLHLQKQECWLVELQLQQQPQLLHSPAEAPICPRPLQTEEPVVG